MITRKKKTYRNGDVIDVEEYPDCRHGAPGTPRAEKGKVTSEQMREINRQHKQRKCREYLLEYFGFGDRLVTFTYLVRNRPKDMMEALGHFQKAIRYIRRQYRKKGYELFWIRNIEKGTRGGWHIHVVVNEIPDTATIVSEAWNRGHVDTVKIKDDDRYYDEDFTKLSAYMTKDENTREEKTDGTMAKPKIKEASYNHSRNMQLIKPNKDKLIRWKKEIKPKKGYYIAHIYEGENPITGHKYRRYTMVRLEWSEKRAGRDLHRHLGKRTKKQKSRICSNRGSSRRKANRPKNRSS